MKLKPKHNDAFQLWKEGREAEGRTQFLEEVVTTAAQVDDWIEKDGLSPDKAFERIVRDKPQLVHPMSPTGIDMRTALGEFWLRGDEFLSYVSARMETNLNEPSGDVAA
jgi:hypothetical protein